jgi:hypothetical protein
MTDIDDSYNDILQKTPFSGANTARNSSDSKRKYY